MTTSSGIRRVSPRHPCQICGKPDWCNHLGDWGAHCERVEEGSRKPANGSGWIHVLAGHEPDWRDTLPAPTPKPTRRTVDPDLADRAYRTLFTHLTLSDKDRHDLSARGLTTEQITRHGYATGPANARERQALAATVCEDLGIDLVGQVPGFIRKNGTLDLVCGDAELLIPVRDVQGRIVGIRRRISLTKDGGKYRWLSAGDGPHSIGVDGNTVHVARPVRTSLVRYVVVTEGEIKANIAADRLGCTVLSVPGVGNLGHVMETLGQLGSVELVAMAMDADSATNPAVAAAEKRLGQHLTDAGYRACRWVWPVEFGKGLDDALQAGIVPVAIPHPETPEPPPHTGPGDGSCAAERSQLADAVAENTVLKRQLGERDATITALTQTILNPHLTHTEKVAAVNIARHADAKRRGGQVEPDGSVVLSASETSDDWRRKPEPGEHIAPVNPDTGTTPHMPRSSARAVLDSALERGILEGKKRGTVRRRKSNDSTWRDWEYVISPATSFAEMLNPWAAWRPDQPKVRKVRESRACPSCGEVHPIKRVDYCAGCGAKVDERTIAPEQPAANANAPMGEIFSLIQPTTLSGASVAEIRNGRNIFSHRSEPMPEEPVWIDTAPDPVEPDMSPDDHGLDAPPLYEAQEILTATTFAHPDITKRALQDVEAQLARVAVQRGRTPVPKPSTRTFAPPDQWAEYAPGVD